MEAVSIYLEKAGQMERTTKVENISTSQYYTLSFQKKPEKQETSSSPSTVTTKYVYNGFCFLIVIFVS